MDKEENTIDEPWEKWKPKFNEFVDKSEELLREIPSEMMGGALRYIAEGIIGKNATDPFQMIGVLQFMLNDWEYERNKEERRREEDKGDGDNGSDWWKKGFRHN